MGHLGGPVARYHKLFEANKYRDLAWAHEFLSRLQTEVAHAAPLGTAILRPHFISNRDLRRLTLATERLTEILDHIETIALHSPPLLDRIHLLPAEKMLAAIPPGYSRVNVSSRVSAHLQNGSISLHDFTPSDASGLACCERLSDLFFDLSLVKDFKRVRFKLTKLGGAGYLIPAVLQAWKEFGGRRQPRVAVLDLKDAATSEPSDAACMVELFMRRNLPARLVTPEELEYRSGKLRAQDFEIDIVFRRVLTRDLLIRFDLSHPLLLAYRDRAVCVVNSFRSEIAQRRALFDLMTDETVTSRLHPADRKLIREFVPWTRVVAQSKTTYRDRQIDLPEFIRHSREKLVLRPNEDTDGHRAYIGAELDERAWDRALVTALRTPYVVQERSPGVCHLFPVLHYGELQMRQMEVSIQPYVFGGRMHGASALLRPLSSIAANPMSITPVLLLERK